MENMQPFSEQLTATAAPETKIFSRWKAAGIHLGISIFIALAVVAAMLLFWYPAPYFNAMGGSGLLLLVVGVDVVLGPLITLIIFNTKKKSLKFDLLFIVVIQVAALAYGVSTMFLARPAYIVFNKDRFDVVIAADISDKERAKGTDEAYKSSPLTGPVIVAMKFPDDLKEVQRMLTSGIESRAFTQYYEPYTTHAKTAAASGRSFAQVLKSNPQSAERIKVFLAENNLEESRVGFLPLYTRNLDMTVILDRESGKILAFAPIAP